MLCGLLTALFCLYGAFRLGRSYSRALEGVKDLALSVAFYFLSLLGLGGVIRPTVTDISSGSSAYMPALPDTASGFGGKLSEFFRLLGSRDNIYSYLRGIFGALNGVIFLFMLSPLLIVLCVLLYRRALNGANNDYNADSKPLRAFKRLSARTYAPLKKRLAGFILFLRGNGVYLKLWAFIWLLNLNVITVILEFVAYIPYLSVSFDVFSLYAYFYKLVLDLSVTFNALPLWAWVIAGLFVFARLRRHIAYERLAHMEMRDRGFIEGLPIVSMVVGTMGKKKTTMLTDMALSQSAMFRDKAFEKLFENDLKFPYFPWVCFERQITSAAEHRQIYNLATCKAFVRKKRERFLYGEFVDPLLSYTPEQYERSRSKLYGYDFAKRGLIYDDKLKAVDLFEVLSIYAQLYFIYRLSSSILLSNYAVREDGILSDTGNFPLWNADFFRRDSTDADGYSRYSHILDFDSLRLGKKVLDGNVKSDSFEYGGVLITEAGKERGNMLEHKGLKKDAAEANALNDGFDKMLKMLRHPSTVDNYPFAKVFLDEQRPESLGADARELCELIHIRDCSESKLALPFFFIEELLHDLIFSRFKRLYYTYRHTRADNTLFMYLLKKLAGVFLRYYGGTYNLFSYCVLEVETERGALDGERDVHKYYLSSKKIYSKRFATDAFGGYFTRKSLRSRVGLADLETYESEKATFAEMDAQHSHFVGEITKHIFKE